MSHQLSHHLVATAQNTDLQFSSMMSKRMSQHVLEEGVINQNGLFLEIFKINREFHEQFRLVHVVLSQAET